MFKYPLILILSGLVFQSSLCAQPGEDKIPALIAKLSDPDFASRENASKEIWGYGVIAVPYLEKASQSKDPEVAARAEVLIRNIAAGILSNTPPEIAELIERYSKNNINGKQMILRELSNKRAYKQMLHMLSWEKNNAHRDMLMREFRNIGLLAARQAIQNDDLNEAIELLKLSPRSDSNLRALAFVMKRAGIIDAEIARIRKFKPNADLDEWMKVLLLVKGDHAQLKEFAQSRGDKEVLATLAMIEGNPTPALGIIQDSMKSKFQSAGVDILRTTALGTGDRSKVSASADKSVAELRKWTRKSENERDMESALRVLYSTGYGKDSHQIFKEYVQGELGYFEFMDTSEKPDAALESIGVPSAKEDPEKYYKWLSDSVAEALDENEDQDVDHQQLIIAVATLYYGRGEKEIARNTLKELLKSLQQEGLDRWYEVVTELPRLGMSEMAVEFVLERGNADNDLERMVNAFYADSLEINRIWKILRSRENSIEKDFIDMAVLMGMYRDKLDKGHQLEAQVLEMARKQGRNSYIDMLFSLAEAAHVRNDMAACLEYYRSISKLGREVQNRGNWQSTYREVAGGLLSWKDYIAAFEAQENELIERPLELSKYAIALKKVGRNREGGKLLDKALTMTLSIPTEYNEIGLLLHQAGYKEQALKIWSDTLISHAPNDWEFHYSLQYMSYISKYYVHNKDWNMAAALSTVEAALGLKQARRDRFNAAYSMRSGFYSYFTNGMLDYQNGHIASAKWKLQRAHDMIIGDGLLADEFYPALRDTDFAAEYDQWFNQDFAYLEEVTKKYPSSHNTHNTIAWLGSRAVRNLDATLEHAKTAVKLSPNQGAYLDTMAEIHFAMKDRESAVKWSNAAVRSISDGSMAYSRSESNVYSSHVDLMGQLQRFKNEPFPSAEVKHKAPNKKK